VVQDRIRVASSNRARFIEACEQAYHFGKGKLAIWPISEKAVGAPRLFSNRFHCANCDIDYRESTPALFSFNHPLGACPACRGFGRTITIDYDLAIPDRFEDAGRRHGEAVANQHRAPTRSAIWRGMCRCARNPDGRSLQSTFGPSTNASSSTAILITAATEEHEWPRAWYGVKGYFPMAGIARLQDARASVALALPRLREMSRLRGQTLPAGVVAVSNR
jgi:excinuclease ABC subunit A